MMAAGGISCIEVDDSDVDVYGCLHVCRFRPCSLGVPVGVGIRHLNTSESNKAATGL